MIRTAVCVFAVCAGALAQSYGLLDELTGPARCSGVVGNGRIAAALDANGRLNELHWPSPGAPTQLSSELSILDGAGAAWGLRYEQGFSWLNAGSLINASGLLVGRNEGAGLEQTILIHPQKDIVAIQLRLKQPIAGHQLVWCADFSPCPKAVAGIPSAEGVFAARRDMLAFADKGVVYHTRGAEMGEYQWDEAARWAAGGQEPGWLKKSAGVWIGYTSPDGIQQSVCAANSDTQSLQTLAEFAPWDSGQKAVGDCISAAHIPIGEDNTATLYIALGERRRDVDDALAYARERGYASLSDESQTWWRDWISAATQPPTQNDVIIALYARALTTLCTATDTNSGAIVRAPFTTPPFAVDFPRLGVWSTLALDLANHRTEAEQHIQFYLNALRQTERTMMPEGSLPAALFGSGAEAAPHVVLDVDAVAWLLWSVWQHDAFVPESDRPKYRRSVWKHVERAADFVTSWSRTIYQTPAFGFDPIRMSDQSCLQTAALAYAGLQSASSLAHVLEEDKPDWAARTAELEDYLRYRALDGDGNFKVADPLPLWPADLVGAGDPRWSQVVQRALEQIPTQSAPEALKSLAHLAMLLRDQKDMLARVEPLLAPTLSRAATEYPGDAYYAALSVTAILTVYSHGSF